MKINSIFFTIVILLHLSCTKLITVDNPAGKLLSETIYQDEKTAQLALTGIYSQMSQQNFLGQSAMTIYPGMSADEFYNTTSNVLDEFSKNALRPTTSQIGGYFWTAAYNYIYQANAVVEGVTQSPNISTATKAQLVGEAKFLRAFFYFCLVNLFGDVPIILQVDYTQNLSVGRADVSKVYDQVFSDLGTAKELLKEAYPSAGKVRCNKFTVMALLARAYLYRSQFEKAEAEIDAIIASGRYQLVADPNSVFLANSNEAIWQQLPVPSTYNTAYTLSFIPSSGVVPIYTVDSSLIKAFEPADKRKSAWLAQTTVQGKVYNYPFKYKVRTGTNVPVTEYNMMVRLGELYLIRAECRAQLGNMDGAIADIDLLRKRAGLPLIRDLTPAISKSDLLAAILHERQAELCFEWGHRWLDLKRTGAIDTVLSKVKGSNWQATDALYPIPLSQIIANPALIQNPGYN
jgi:hypothetical protein